MMDLYQSITTSHAAYKPDIGGNFTMNGVLRINVKKINRIYGRKLADWN
jgi:hypothetical protein